MEHYCTWRQACHWLPKIGICRHISGHARLSQHLSLTVSSRRWTFGVCTRSCFYQRCCQVRAVRESSYGNYVVHPLLFTHLATCAIEPITPNVTRTRYSPALTGPVLVGVNATITIWCHASATVVFMGRKTLRGLFWQYSNGTRLPVVERGVSSDLDVYAECYSGSVGADTRTWRRLLHFKRIQPSSTGNYTCVANYSQNFPQSVEIRLTGGWMVYMVATQIVLWLSYGSSKVARHGQGMRWKIRKH